MDDAVTYSAANERIFSSHRGTLRWIQRSSIIVVALCRPKVKNAINDDVYEDLVDILRDTANDDSIQALVLTGTGPYFSSGADLKSATLTKNSNSNSNNNSTDNSTLPLLERPTGKFMMQLLQYPKVLAAAVNGPAVGIGVTMLLHFDLVYCSPTATFWTPFSRIAFVPELCSSVTFPERMGLSKANELLLMGKKIDAKTAVEWNICSRVVAVTGMKGNIHNVRDNTGHENRINYDPFHPNSLASRMASTIDTDLLQLSGSTRTVALFTKLTRLRHRPRLQAICQEELRILDERFDRGEVAAAAQQLGFTSTNNKQNTKTVDTKRSKL